MGNLNRPRVWRIFPLKKNLYIGGFEGTFLEAFESAQKKAAANKSDYEVWEADPSRYRRKGGLKKPWAIVPRP